MTSTLSMLADCALLALAASLGVFQIITRFVLETPAEWSEVMIRFSLIWMVFLGIPTAFRQGAMVSVDVLYRWWGWDYASRGKVQTMIGLEDVSMFWAYLAMPVGGVFSILGIIGNLLDPQRLELETAQ